MKDMGSSMASACEKEGQKTGDGDKRMGECKGDSIRRGLRSKKGVEG